MWLSKHPQVPPVSVCVTKPSHLSVICCSALFSTLILEGQLKTWSCGRRLFWRYFRTLILFFFLNVCFYGNWGDINRQNWLTSGCRFFLLPAFPWRRGSANKVKLIESNQTCICGFSPSKWNGVFVNPWARSWNVWKKWIFLGGFGTCMLFLLWRKPHCVCDGM